MSSKKKYTNKSKLTKTTQKMPQMSQYHKLNKEIRDLNIHFSKPVVESQNAAIKLVSNKLSFMQRYQRFKSLDFCRTQANGHPTNKVTHVDRTFRNYCNIVDKMDKLIEIYQVNEIQGYGLGFESGFLVGFSVPNFFLRLGPKTAPHKPSSFSD